MAFNLFKPRKSQISLLLLSLTALAVILLIFRFYWTGQLTYWSLTWNLFLAWIPFTISSIGRIYEVRLTGLTIIPVVALWLLFFPNVPYILIDLFHLETRGGMPKWFNLLMVLTFAWTGLIMGDCLIDEHTTPGF